MIRTVLVFGVLAAFAAAQFGRGPPFDRRRNFQCYARGEDSEFCSKLARNQLADQLSTLRIFYSVLRSEFVFFFLRL